MAKEIVSKILSRLVIESWPIQPPYINLINTYFINRMLIAFSWPTEFLVHTHTTS